MGGQALQQSLDSFIIFRIIPAGVQRYTRWTSKLKTCLQVDDDSGVENKVATNPPTQTEKAREQKGFSPGRYRRL